MTSVIMSSKVWENFDKDGLNSVKCTHCDKSMKYYTATSSMQYNIKSKHPDKLTKGNLKKDEGEENKGMKCTLQKLLRTSGTQS